MVYCRKLNNTVDGARYNIGCLPTDADGVIVFRENDLPVYEKQPEKPVSNLWLGKLLHKYRNVFSQGIFPDTLAYECGRDRFHE